MRQRSAEDKARAKAIGERLHEAAHAFRPGGVSGFQKALLKAGVPGVSGRKELYAKFKGQSGISAELLIVASRVLSLRREWLEAGELPRFLESAEPDSKQQRERRVAFQRALEKAFRAKAASAEEAKTLARAIALDSIYLEIENGYADDEQASLLRERMVECIADLYDASPSLRGVDRLVGCTDHLLGLYAEFSVFMAEVNPFGEHFRKGAWAVVWAMVKYTAAGAYPETWWMAYRSLNAVTFQLKRGEDLVVDAAGRNITPNTKG